MALEEYRNKIDEIDEKIAQLFQERMETVTKVGQYKKENGIPILNRKREEEVLEKNANRLREDLQEEGREFFENLMAISRAYQHKIISNEVKSSKKTMVSVGYPGVKGSFGYQAMVEYFKLDEESKNYTEFEDIFIGMKKEEIEYGILPIENSSTGAINKVYDLLRKYGFSIVGEQCIKIDQNILGIPGTTLLDIKEVYSHPQGFEQSSRFLSGYSDWRLIPYHNTAMSAKYVMELNDKSKAAIASREAAKIYGLQIIKEGINDNRNNTTRFIVIGKSLEVQEEADKISVVFTLKHEAGNLYNSLRFFAENSINLLKIESRPMEESNWEYFFYIDFEGNLRSEAVKNALKKLEEDSSYFRILGCYKKMSMEI